MLLLISLILLFTLGFLFTLLIFKRIHIAERIAYSILFGIGLFTLVVFLASYFHFNFTSTNVIVLMVVSILMLGLLIRLLNIGISREKLLITAGFSELTQLEKGILGILAFTLFVSFLLAIYWPINVWDALALYDFRAKVLATSGDLFWTLGSYRYFAAYPPLTSILHALIYVSGGATPQFVYTLIYFSFLIIFYFRIVDLATRKTGLLLTLLTALIPTVFQHSTIAYTNLLYSSYFFISTTYIFLFAKSAKAVNLVVAAIASGFASWTRSYEPFWVANILFLIFIFLVKRDFGKLKTYLIYPFIFFPIQLMWIQFLEDVLGRPYSSLGLIKSSYSAFRIDIGQALIVLQYIFEKVVVSWGLIFWLFVLVVIRKLMSHKWSFRDYYPILVLINLSVLIGGTYFFSLADPSWKDISESARRMSMIFMPLFTFYVGISDTR